MGKYHPSDCIERPLSSAEGTLGRRRSGALGRRLMAGLGRMDGRAPGRAGCTRKSCGSGADQLSESLGASDRRSG